MTNKTFVESKVERFKEAFSALKDMWRNPNTSRLVFLHFYGGLVNGCILQVMFDYSRLALSLGTNSRVFMLIGIGVTLMISMATMSRVTKFYGNECNMLLVHTLLNALNIALLPFITSEYILYISLFGHFFLTSGFMAINLELMKNVDHELHGSVQGGKRFSPRIFHTWTIYSLLHGIAAD